MDKPHQKIIKTHLTRPIRLAIMFTLIASFFVISPFLIAYASGYRYNFNKHKIIKTGVLNIDIEPTDSQVFINGELIEKKIPFNISLFPDTYLLTIKKTGYKTWEKNISINSKQTTYINYFELLKDELPLFTEISNVKEILGTDNSENVLLLSKSTNDFTKVTSLNIKNNSNKNFPEDLNILDYSVSPFADFVYLLIEKDNQKQILLYDLNKNTEQLISLENIGKVQWQDSKNNPLILETNDNIITIYNNGNQRVIKKSASSTNWYIDTNENIWEYENGQLKKYNENYNIPEKIEEIVDINENRIIAKNNSGYFVYNIKTEKIDYINGENILFNLANQSWIIYSESDITEIRKDGVINLQYRSGEQIKNLQLLDEGSLYVMSTENALTVLDIDKYLQMPILMQSENKLYVNKKYKELFYTTDSEKLYSLKF